MRRQAGFTLIELMVVVFIIGILASVALPVFNGQQTRSRNGQAKAALLDALAAAKAYEADNDNFNNFTVANDGDTLPYDPNLTGADFWRPTASGQCGWNCVPSTSRSANRISYITTNYDTGAPIWQNFSRSNQASSMALCNSGRGDRSYCLLYIPYPDNNFAGVAPGVYYGESRPNVDHCAGLGAPNIYTLNSQFQAVCQIIVDGYPKKWRD